MNLMEAFTALDKLNEDIFTVDAEGIKKLQDFVQNDDTVDELDVFNLNAEPDEDIDENECHIGDAILDCCVCHSKVFKPVAEIIVDEESQLANVGDECPYCYSVEGYKVVGEVTPVDNDEDVVEIKDEDAIEVEDSTEQIEESFNPSVPGFENESRKLIGESRTNVLKQLVNSGYTIKEIQKLFEEETGLEMIPKNKEQFNSWANKFIKSIKESKKSGLHKFVRKKPIEEDIDEVNISTDDVDIEIEDKDSDNEIIVTDKSTSEFDISKDLAESTRYEGEIYNSVEQLIGHVPIDGYTNRREIAKSYYDKLPDFKKFRIITFKHPSGEIDVAYFYTSIWYGSELVYNKNVRYNDKDYAEYWQSYSFVFNQIKNELEDIIDVPGAKFLHWGAPKKSDYDEVTEETMHESICSNLKEDWNKGVLISMNLPLSEVEKAANESKISIPAYSDGEWNSTTSLRVYGFPDSYGMVDKDKGIFELKTNFYDSDIKEFGTLRDFNKAVRENDFSLFGDAVLNYTKQIKDSLVKKGISVQDTTIELKTGDQSIRKSVNESVDLLTKENTIASLLKDNMSELASIIDVNELRERVIELVDNSDIAGKPAAQKLKRDLYSKKSAGALLSTIATYMTGEKVVKTGRYKKAVNNDEYSSLLGESKSLNEPNHHEILDWLSEHEQAYEDAEIFFEETPLYDVSKDDLLSWIQDHELLWDDFKTFFNIENLGDDDEFDESCKRKSIKESDSNEETIGNKLKKYQMWVDYDMEHYGRVSKTTQDIIAKEGLQLIKDQYGDYEVSVGSYKSESMKKRLKEDIDSIEIKTDDVSVVIDSAESVEKEEEIVPEGSCEECSAEQTIEPVSEETKEEIEIENIDKDTIEDAVEECLTESFANVKFFKASDIIQRKNRFIVEGIVGFKSGKKRNTNFVFRPSLLNESKIVFRGFNRDLKESVKSISLNCKKQGNKIIVESCKVSK